MNTICCLPWNHLATHPNGTVSLCCQSEMKNAASFAKTNGKLLNLDSSSIIEIVNSDTFKKVRLEMLNGKEPEECARCYESERSTGQSKRLYENNRFYKSNHSKPYAYEDVSIHPYFEFIELRLGNTCNLTCLTCNGVSSSSWLPIEKKLEEKIKWFKPIGQRQSKWFTSEEFYKTLATHSSNLKTIYINGGEPLLIKEHKTLLKTLIEYGIQKNVSLQYSTNLTVYDKEIVELWKEFSYVEVMCSIDAPGTQNNIIRPPSIWSYVEGVLSQYLNVNSKNIKIIVCQTISALSAEFAGEMQDWTRAIGVRHILNFVENPSYFGSSALPNSIKEKILKKNTGLEKIDLLESWLNTEYAEEENKKLKEFVKGFYELRGQSYDDYIKKLFLALDDD